MSNNKLLDSFTFSKIITGTNEVTVLTLPTHEELYPGITNTYYVSTYTKLESLQLTVNLGSFPKAPIPETSFRDSESEKQAKLMAVYDAFAKVGLRLLVDSGEEFVEHSQVKLQNRGSETYLPLLQPYLCMTEVQMLGKADHIAIQIIDLGSGVLKTGDSILIKGSYVQERHTLPKVVGVAHVVYSGIYSADG